jgi:hypothetical protein
MSGASNVQYFLSSRGLPTTPEAVESVLALAKKSERLLTEAEILEAVDSVKDLN